MLMVSYESCLNTRVSVVFFFFLMIRRPPRSTLFPSTTLSRSHRPPESRRSWFGPSGDAARSGTDPIAPRRPERSEEHTSELQSLAYLGFRLLLEKKKIMIPMTAPTVTFSIARMDRIITTRQVL